jgi:hypothetical protein
MPCPSLSPSVCGDAIFSKLHQTFQLPWRCSKQSTPVPDSLATFHNCKVSHCRFAPNIDKGVTLCFDSTVKQIVITSRPQVCSRVDMFLANSFEFYVISEGPRCVQDVMAGSIANHQQVFCCRDDEP